MWEKCSIVGFMPHGFCCERCKLYDASHTCLNTRTKPKIIEAEKVKEKLEKIHPIRTTIEDGFLKVVLKQADKEIPIVIDLQKQLDSK